MRRIAKIRLESPSSENDVALLRIYARPWQQRGAIGAIVASVGIWLSTTKDGSAALKWLRRAFRAPVEIIDDSKRKLLTHGCCSLTWCDSAR
jgi:hypothetical protein